MRIRFVKGFGHPNEEVLVTRLQGEGVVRVENYMNGEIVPMLISADGELTYIAHIVPGEKRDIEGVSEKEDSLTFILPGDLILNVTV